MEANKLALDVKNNPNSHFLVLEFKKVKSFGKEPSESTKNLLKLEGCVYKKR